MLIVPDELCAWACSEAKKTQSPNAQDKIRKKMWRMFVPEKRPESNQPFEGYSSASSEVLFVIGSALNMDITNPALI